MGRFFCRFPKENVHFGRSLAQLTLAALSLYPFEVKEGPERRFLSFAPSGRFSLPAYPSVGFAASGPYWSLLAGPDSDFLGLHEQSDFLGLPELELDFLGTSCL